MPCARIARAVRELGTWRRREFFGGIPGTLGGALAMNAGAFGDETWRHVISVETIDRRGQRRERTRAGFSIGYRHVEPLEPGRQAAEEEWFLSAELQFEPRSRCSRAHRALADCSGAADPADRPAGAAARCSRIRPAIMPRG